MDATATDEVEGSAADEVATAGVATVGERVTGEIAVSAFVVILVRKQMCKGKFKVTIN